MKQFKIRCSAIGQIMTNPRAKKDIEAGLLSATSKTYCEEWVKEQIYQRRKQFSNKYTEKGLVMEDNSLDFIAENLGYGVLIKNEDYFENDFLTGTPDVILDDHLIDVKNSWDCFTFPLFSDKIDKAYFYQAQGYMALTGKESYKLIYTLMDTPEYLIDKEFKYNNFYEKDYDEFEKDYLYNDVDPKYRIKVFEIQRDDEVIEAINKRVEECRNYIKTLV